MTFEINLKDTLNFEGGYVNDPLDRGGETFRGISRRNWPKWGGWALIDDAKKTVGGSRTAIDNYFKDNAQMESLVFDFYKANFWKPFDYDDIPERIKSKLFDAAVNCGIKRAIIILQKTLNRLGNKLAVDGSLGPKTIAAVKIVPSVNEVLKVYSNEQLNYYRAIVSGNPKQVRFLKGWERRAAWLPK